MPLNMLFTMKPYVAIGLCFDDVIR